MDGALVLFPGDDIRWNIDKVSDNQTIIDAELEYYEIKSFS